jgi:hypothetical protein
MMAADFDPRTQSVGVPRVLSQINIIAPKFILRQYDVAAGGHFLINSLPPGSAPPVTVITDWTAEKRK